MHRGMCNSSHHVLNTWRNEQSFSNSIKHPCVIVMNPCPNAVVNCYNNIRCVAHESLRKKSKPWFMISSLELCFLVLACNMFTAASQWVDDMLITICPFYLLIWLLCIPSSVARLRLGCVEALIMHTGRVNGNLSSVWIFFIWRWKQHGHHFANNIFYCISWKKAIVFWYIFY